MLDLVLHALMELNASSDGDHCAPTKQGGE